MNRDIISQNVDNIYKTKKELETIPIPELYNLSHDIFQSPTYKFKGFKGINGLQLITSKQTIMASSPDTEATRHAVLYYEICKKIYDEEKVKIFNGIVSNGIVSYQDSNINHITIAHINSIFEKNKEINVHNFCVIYGNLNKINNYQKRILIETINSIIKKDSNIEIYHYDSHKEIGIKEIESIIPKDEIAIDDGEKILSDKESDYVIDLSKYHNKNKIEYIYQYIEDEKKIYQIEKTDSIEFENKSDYLDPKSLNIMLINKVKVESSELNLTKEKKHILLK